MTFWPFLVVELSPAQIQEAIKDEEWQTFRKSLKGVSTHEKLERLKDYYLTWGGAQNNKVQTQVCNYINALKRGGQLDCNYEVQRSV